MKLSLHDRLYLSPLPKDKPLSILDLGTGTGIWAKDVTSHTTLALPLSLTITSS